MRNWIGTQRRQTRVFPDDEDSQKLLIYESELDQIAQWVSCYTDTETGGDMYGYWSHSGAPIVSYIVGPGRRSVHNVTSFYQDTDLMEVAGCELFDRFGLQYIGEFHSHHRIGLSRPSSGDTTTVKNGMLKNDWFRFVLMIANINGYEKLEVTQSYYLFTQSTGCKPIPVSVSILPGQSPFRKVVNDQNWPLERKKGVPRHLSWNLPLEHTTQPRTTAIDPKLVEGPFRDAWFAHAEGQEVLKQVIDDFDESNLSCKIFFEKDGQAVRLVIKKGIEYEIKLPSGFPDKPPEITKPRPLRAPIPDWKSETNLAKAFVKILADFESKKERKDGKPLRRKNKQRRRKKN